MDYNLMNLTNIETTKTYKINGQSRAISGCINSSGVLKDDLGTVLNQKD
jgi:hypothetical protein